jgi:hypothetical protein
MVVITMAMVVITDLQKKNRWIWFYSISESSILAIIFFLFLHMFTTF